MTIFRNLLAFVAVSLALTGCLNSSGAPQSSFTLLDGSSRTTADLKGKVALINFWATSCTTCVAEMPMLVSTYEKFRSRGYETIAVAMSYDPPTYVVNFAQTRKLPFPVAIDNTGTVAKAWGDGRWLTSGSLAGTNARALLVVDQLVTLAKKAR